MEEGNYFKYNDEIGFMVHPNPVINEFEIGQNNSQSHIYYIINLCGKIVATFRYVDRSKPIILSVRAGVYIIRNQSSGKSQKIVFT
ncbi:T9SS type A sorting domain-containing protein [Halosquirtibacter xylanolyticus]|uniref:T9SS type A sorting domain-containing protein n=1 Tax=Halosquirtibacter xylanolyticus TaxID=3374599 RepID=UPI00374A48FE|nr:T9SS type A sorting domain-containing protein [Prolixibacteraceae bacterium]